MKTIKQIADELGIDKQKVYRYIKRNHIKEAHQDSITMYYDEATESLIKGHFSSIIKSDETHQSTLNAHDDAVIDMLRETIATLQNQLVVKDKQIAEVTEALVSTTKSLEAAHALHAGTMQNQKQLTGFTLEPDEGDLPEGEKKASAEEPQNINFLERFKRLFK